MKWINILETINNFEHLTDVTGLLKRCNRCDFLFIFFMLNEYWSGYCVLQYEQISLNKVLLMITKFIQFHLKFGDFLTSDKLHSFTLPLKKLL